MYTNRKSAAIIGALFLIAMVASLVGGGLIEPIITGEDYLTSVSSSSTQLSIGIPLEMVNAVAVFGIAIFFYPILRQKSERTAIGYITFRITEAIACIAAAILPLSYLALSREYVKAGVTDASYFQTIGSLLYTARADIGRLMVPIFFIMGALLLYSTLYTMKIVPKFIAAWGFIGAILVIVPNLYEISITIKMIMALPMITNEVFFGGWLIVKGFKTPITIAK